MGNLSYTMSQEEMTRVIQQYVEAKGYEYISMNYIWSRGGSPKLSAEIELNVKQVVTK